MMARAFTDQHFETLARCETRQSWPDASPADQAVLRDLRECVADYGRELRQRVRSKVPLQSFVSILNPNGRTPIDYWTCLYPNSAGNKSYAFQLFLIVGRERVEIGFCSGSATSQIQDTVERQDLQSQLAQARRRLAASVGTLSSGALQAQLFDAGFSFRRRWRGRPDEELLPDMRTWLTLAAGDEGAGATVSTYIERQEAVSLGTRLIDRAADALQMLVPFIDAAYAKEGPLETSGRPVGAPPASDRAWVFQANPTLYDLQGALSELTELPWTVRQHRDEVHAGDLVFLWESGPNAGVVATAGVLNEPTEEDEEPRSRVFNRDDEAFRGRQLRVRLRIDRVLPERVRREALREHPALARLPVLVAPQGTNFPVLSGQLWPLEALVVANDGRLVLKVAPGRGARFWDDCLRAGYICVGWDDVGDLLKYRDGEEFRAAFKEAYGPGYNNHEPQITRKANEVWRLRDLRPGDLIVANRGTSAVLAVGRVLDPPYEWRTDRSDHQHTIRVRWDTSFAKDIPPQGEWAMTTVAPVPPDLFRLIIGDESPADPLTQLAERLLLDRAQLARTERLLKDKRQIVFYGPPGTGKTYVARELARFLAGTGTVEVVQFHPSYAYEDFVEGFRPDENGRFRLKDGPLKRLAQTAKESPDTTHVLVIDEINRGNVAKVFGELYFLLEYRNEDVWLQYGEKQFALPENLWIIGTMNTADRSIALFDAALRRRFYFVPFFPDQPLMGGLLRRWLAKHKPDMAWVADVVDEANRRLGDRHGAIGPSHFLRPDLDDEWVELIWEHSVLPYLEEQLMGEEGRLKSFSLAALRKVSVPEQGSVDEDGGA